MDSGTKVPRSICRWLVSKYCKYSGNSSSAMFCKTFYWFRKNGLLESGSNASVRWMLLCKFSFLKLKIQPKQVTTTRACCLSKAWRGVSVRLLRRRGAGMHTFFATHFASGILCRHIPLDTGIQHPEQHMHTGEGLGLTDCCLPLLHGWSNLQTDLTTYNEAHRHTSLQSEDVFNILYLGPLITKTQLYFFSFSIASAVLFVAHP